MAGGQVGEQKAPAGFFLPLFNPGLAVTARLPPRLNADGCSAPGPAPPHAAGSHLPRAACSHLRAPARQPGPKYNVP